jgi:mannosyltransferase
MVAAHMSTAAEEQERGVPRRWLVALVVLAAIARLYALGRQSFWYDEAMSVVLADNSLGALLGGQAKDLGNPPLYPVLLRLWMTLFGASDGALRSLSAVLGAATVPLVYSVGRQALGARTAFVGAALFAFSPFQLQMAQEARTYTLLVLLAAAAMAFLVRALAHPRQWAWWVAFGATTGLMCLSHYFSFFLALGLAGYLAFTYRRQPAVLGRAAGAFLVSLAVFAFWLPSFFGQLGVQGNLARSAESWHLHLLATPLVFGVGSTLVWKDSATIWRLALGLLAIATLAGCLMRGLWQSCRRPGFGPLVTWMAAPILLPALISLAASPLYNTRYVILASVPFYLFIAAGLRALPRPAQVTGAVALAGVALVSQGSYLSRPVKHQWREVAALIEPQLREGDVLLFDADYNETAYAHYAGRPGKGPRLRLLPPSASATATPAPGPATGGHLFGAVAEGAPTTDVTDLVNRHRRVWLVLADADEDTAEQARSFLGKWRSAPPVELRGISVLRYERP